MRVTGRGALDLDVAVRSPTSTVQRQSNDRVGSSAAGVASAIVLAATFASVLDSKPSQFAFATVAVCGSVGLTNTSSPRCHPSGLRSSAMPDDCPAASGPARCNQAVFRSTLQVEPAGAHDPGDVRGEAGIAATADELAVVDPDEPQTMRLATRSACRGMTVHDHVAAREQLDAAGRIEGEISGHGESRDARAHVELRSPTAIVTVLPGPGACRLKPGGRIGPRRSECWSRCE